MVNFLESKAHRPTTMAKNGMVTSPHYLASQAGLHVLRNGGNAVDAAIAVASTLAVVYPHMNSIGGDNFWLIYNAKKQDVRGLNASGRSGEKATISFYIDQNFNSIPSRGYLAANTVPGVISGWNEAYQYASQEMNTSLPWSDILQPAIDYAKNGFPVTPSQVYWTKVNLDAQDKEFRYLQRFKEFKKTFLKANEMTYKTGEILTLKDLASTLEVIAKEGADAFYRGVIAEKIVNDLQEHDGLLTKDDFVQHRANWVDPVSVDYRQYRAYNLPPNTQGMASLSILNILNHFDLKKIGEGTVDYYHLLIEAIKQSFADRDQWLTDPDFIDIPLNKLLSPEHGKYLSQKIDLNQTNNHVKLLDPKGDTVWLGIVDQEGNAVSMIQSIYHDFGSGIVAKDTGVLLQNRGSFFSLDPNHVNCLEPRKRTFHTLNPAMLFKEKKPYLVYGTMGGEGQPQTQAAIVTRIIDFNYSVQEAIEAPRWLYGRTWGSNSNNIKVEGRIHQEIMKGLKQKGHPIEVVDDYTDIMGHAGAILIDPKTKLKYGGADPRGDGAAVGY